MNVSSKRRMDQIIFEQACPITISRALECNPDRKVWHVGCKELDEWTVDEDFDKAILKLWDILGSEERV